MEYVEREYCEDAFKLMGIKVFCDVCPFLNKCPRLIMEDAVDEAVPKAIEAMLTFIAEMREMVFGAKSNKGG